MQCEVRDNQVMEILDAILDRLIPADTSPGAVALGLGTAVRLLVPNLEALLAECSDFTSLDSAAQDDALRALEERDNETFRTLVTRAHELFYADPRSWRALGYTSRIPGRP
jgi:hypothetical protein